MTSSMDRAAQFSHLSKCVRQNELLPSYTILFCLRPFCFPIGLKFLLISSNGLRPVETWRVVKWHSKKKLASISVASCPSNKLRLTFDSLKQEKKGQSQVSCFWEIFMFLYGSYCSFFFLFLKRGGGVWGWRSAVSVAPVPLLSAPEIQ